MRHVSRRLHANSESALYSRKQRLTGQPPYTSTARRTATGRHDHGTEDSHWRARAQVFRGAPITNPRQREVYIAETLNKLTLRGIYFTPPCRVILHLVTLVENAGRLWRKEDQLYHINLLKRWVGTRTQLATLATSDPGVVDMNALLSDAQKKDLHHLIGQFSDVFFPIPGRTQVLQHDIRTPPGTVVRQRPYRVPEARRHAIEEEVQEMLRLGVIEPSRSPWSSPIVMVPKPDGTLRFCNDFRRLNEVSEFDGYPMPRVDELLDRLGGTRYISTLDLTKGYWQVPLTEEAKPKTAFSTPSGHWQYRVLPFGLHGAPATFQRMMDILLRPHQSYAATYLDDVVVHSESWEEHLAQLRRVLLELRRAGLTANPPASVTWPSSRRGTWASRWGGA